MQLKQIAGASVTDQAEEKHISILAITPVPLYIRFVPVDIQADTPVLRWEAASPKGNPSSPPLTLALWTRGGDGVHFDIIEFVRPIAIGEGSPSDHRTTRAPTNQVAQCQRTKVPARKRGVKRNANQSHAPRILYRWVHGNAVRIRDE